MNKQTQPQEPIHPTLLNNAPNLKPLTNPLIVEEVVEHLFTLIKNADGTRSLGSYRLVCKLLDKEIVKLTRSGTKINLEHILLPYPDGMGWAASEKRSSFRYNIPYPEVRPFENIMLSTNFWEIFPSRHTKLEQWFKLMGNQVNKIGFEFPLHDFDKSSKFLDRILKEWCPNLQSITLGGILPAKHIIFVSLFTDTTKEIICKNLKEVTIIGEIIGDCSLMNSDRFPFIMSQQFNRFIHQHGLPGCSTEFPKCKNRSGMEVFVPRELLSKSEFPDISQFIPENFFPEVLDGGVLGQIMSSTSVEKLSMLKCINPENFGTFVAFSHFRKNCWRSSLKHLELYVTQMRNISKNLVVFAKLRYPLTTLKFKENFDSENPIKKTANITRFLAHFAETLQHLEYIGAITDEYEASPNLVLPLLPKLKTFIFKGMMECPICPINLLSNLPNLNNFCLEVMECRIDGHQRADVYMFIDTDVGNVRNDRLKTLKVTAAISGSRGCKLLKWFPKVERLILNIQDEDVGITTFLNQLASLGVKHLEIQLTRDDGNVANVLRNTTAIREFSKLKDLESLSIHQFDTSPPHFQGQVRSWSLPSEVMIYPVLPAEFSEGFGLLKKLHLLRLTNFVVYEDHKQKIRECLAHIPLVEFIDCTYLESEYDMY